MAKLIIVDDEKSTREGLVQYIPWNSLGIDEVESAGSGPEALAAAARMRPDILLSDIRMPGMNGIEFATRLRLVLPDCKIIFLSGYADKEYLKSAIRLRAVHYLEKPINRPELIRAVRETVDALALERITAAESDAIIREKLALDLIREHTDPAGLAQQIKYAFGEPQPGGRYVASILRIDIQTDGAADIDRHGIDRNYREPIRRAIDEAFGSPLYRHIVGFIDNRHVVIHFCGIGITSRSLPPAALGRLKAMIEAAIGAEVDLFMGVGGSTDRISEVRASYEHAESALQRRFFTGPNQVAIYEEPAADTPPYPLDDSRLLPFISSLHAFDTDQALRHLVRLHDEIRLRPDLPVGRVRTFFYGMLLELDAFAAKHSVPLAEPNELAYARDAFFRLPDLAAIRSELLRRIEAALSRVQAKNNNGQHVYAIMQYIREHYHEDGLSINRMAEHLYLTPTYLCRIFKEKTGKTINRHITEVRIEKAKEYLKDGRVKLSDVSSRVGYQSANHFTKLFKKMTGLNPSEFKERQ
ncbi:two-component system, response regulator YesN [Cohnella sp. OV330]|uniref:response regulator n=1 Tax=Cohnella sp. OV330 TaxID=1855288 RepID=UPI0008E259E3|nr:response regulator [Cohnella sp. OV330]SFB51415.1 two-component system, response regulator YesN [Cohnella sp. OV330]